MPSTDVAVLGGGLAGLAAAARLAEAGVGVELLEARQRVGGRVYTLREPFNDGLYAEAGAEFISPGHLVLRRYLDRYGFSVQPRPLGPRRYYFRGKHGRGWSLADLEPRLELDLEHVHRAVEDLASTVPPGQPWTAPDAAALDRQSLGSWLDGLSLDPLARAYYQTWTTIDYGVEPEQLSLLMYARDERMILDSTDRPPEFLLGGLDRLPRVMADRLGPRLHPGTVVTGASQDASGVTVEYVRAGARGSLVARFAIVALPMTALRQLWIRPALEPGLRQVIDGLRYSHVLRIHLQFRRRFWNDQGLTSGVLTDLPLQSAWDSTHAQPGQRGILTVYTAGRSALELSALPEPRQFKHCLDQLEQIYPGCSSYWERGSSVDWSNEADSLGAYSRFAPGELTRFGPWLGRIAGRLHFAGEHTEAWQATMNGALVSGERTADEVLARLGA